MSTEKMRKFKAWWLDDQQAELRSSCAEGWALIIWQASRATIEVELNAWGCDEGFDVVDESDIRHQLESLGLKVKS